MCLISFIILPLFYTRKKVCFLLKSPTWDPHAFETIFSTREIVFQVKQIHNADKGSRHKEFQKAIA